VADNPTVNGVVVAGKDRGGVIYQTLLPGAGGTGSHGALAVTTTATLHVAANGGRRYIILQNQGTVNVHYGYSTAIGPGLSNYIAPGDSATLEVTSAIYLAAASGTATVTYDDVLN